MVTQSGPGSEPGVDYGTWHLGWADMLVLIVEVDRTMLERVPTQTERRMELLKQIWIVEMVLVQVQAQIGQMFLGVL